MAELAHNLEPKQPPIPSEPEETLVDWAENQAVIEPENQVIDNDEERQIAEAKKTIQEIGADFKRGLDVASSTEDDPQAIIDLEQQQNQHQNAVRENKREQLLKTALAENRQTGDNAQAEIKAILGSDPGMVGPARVTKEDLILPEALRTHEKYSQLARENSKPFNRLKKFFGGVKEKMFKMFSRPEKPGKFLIQDILQHASPYMQPKFAEKFEKRVHDLAAEAYPEHDSQKIADFAKFARVKMEKNSGQLSKNDLQILKNTILGKN